MLEKLRSLIPTRIPSAGIAREKTKASQEREFKNVLRELDRNITKSIQSHEFNAKLDITVQDQKTFDTYSKVIKTLYEKKEYIVDIQQVEMWETEPDDPRAAMSILICW